MPLAHVSVEVPASKVNELVTFLINSLQHLGFKEYFRPIPSVVGMGDESPYLWITGVEFEGSDEATVAKILNKHHVAFNATGESHPWHLLPAVVIEL